MSSPTQNSPNTGRNLTELAKTHAQVATFNVAKEVADMGKGKDAEAEWKDFVDRAEKKARDAVPKHVLSKGGDDIIVSTFSHVGIAPVLTIWIHKTYERNLEYNQREGTYKWKPFGFHLGLA